jgi:hypothetical protein
MTLAEFIKSTFKDTFTPLFRPKIVCEDGFTMSVQGSHGHYCMPRENSSLYYAMEIGYPSQVETLLLEFAEDPSTPTETVYSYVPIEVIERVIESHGGIDEEMTFNSEKKILDI